MEVTMFYLGLFIGGITGILLMCIIAFASGVDDHSRAYGDDKR